MTTEPLPSMHLLEEVAEKYQLSLLSLQRWARRDDCFTHIRIGKKRYLTDEMVLALLTASTVTAKATSQREQDLAATQERQTRRRSRKTPLSNAA